MIQIIKTKDEFLGMRDKWNTLLSSMEEPCIFLTWEWVYTWWDFYFSGDSSCQLFIITVFNGGGQLIVILPAYLKKCRGPLRILYTKLKVLGSEAEAPDYLDIIAESTNSQNPVKTRDLRSNDEIQLLLERNLLENLRKL